MKEIIYDLLCVGKSHKTFTINPEVCEETVPTDTHTHTHTHIHAQDQTFL